MLTCVNEFVLIATPLWYHPRKCLKRCQDQFPQLHYKGKKYSISSLCVTHNFFKMVIATA